MSWATITRLAWKSLLCGAFLFVNEHKKYINTKDESSMKKPQKTMTRIDLCRFATDCFRKVRQVTRRTPMLANPYTPGAGFMLTYLAGRDRLVNRSRKPSVTILK